jgi:hypothetical protein
MFKSLKQQKFTKQKCESRNLPSELENLTSEKAAKREFDFTQRK